MYLIIIVIIKIFSFLCSVIGIILLASKDLYKWHLKLNDRDIYNQLSKEDKIYEKIDKFKAFQIIYDKYNFLILGLSLSIIGIVVSLICK